MTQHIFDALGHTVYSSGQVLLVPVASGLQLQISLRNIKKGEKCHIERISYAVGRNNRIDGLVDKISNPLYFFGRRIRT